MKYSNCINFKLGTVFYILVIIGFFADFGFERMGLCLIIGNTFYILSYIVSKLQK